MSSASSSTLSQSIMGLLDDVLGDESTAGGAAAAASVQRASQALRVQQARIEELERANAQLLSFHDEARARYELSTARDAESAEQRRRVTSLEYELLRAQRAATQTDIEHAKEVASLSEQLTAK